MKKLLLPVMFLSALALSGATVPAVAVEAAPVAVVESAPIVADSGAVLSAAEPSVETVAAPVALEPVTVPAPNVEPSPSPAATAAPSEPAVEPAAPVVEPSTATVATAPADSYVPTPPSTADTVATCQEDMPCWDCPTMGNGICGNPACKAQNLFTVDTAGTCGKIPADFTEEQVRADALLTFYSGHDPVDMPADMRAWFDAHYVYSGVLPVEGHHYIYSRTIPGAVYSFDA